MKTTKIILRNHPTYKRRRCALASISIVSWIFSLCVFSILFAFLLANTLTYDSIIQLGQGMQYGFTEQMKADLELLNHERGLLFKIFVFFIPNFILSLICGIIFNWSGKLVFKSFLYKDI